jgi:hypothetical protein
VSTAKETGRDEKEENRKKIILQVGAFSYLILYAVSISAKFVNGHHNAIDNIYYVSSDMGGACSTNGVKRGMHIGYWLESQKERHHWEEQDVDVWAVLKWNLER